MRLDVLLADLIGQDRAYGLTHPKRTFVGREFDLVAPELRRGDFAVEGLQAQLDGEIGCEGDLSHRSPPRVGGPRTDPRDAREFLLRAAPGRPCRSGPGRIPPSTCCSLFSFRALESQRLLLALSICMTSARKATGKVLTAAREFVLYLRKSCI